ncbi:tryptophan 7-halogenase [Sphingomonas ginsenosidivorax]|uniref:Tryptophan 7-halogenase n=1 Tax=Sphingomonas ginsenosidivorax TaxID=862135 RepID=A0A5C6UHC1_9SPHN|nr:tryptophan halogenase family protein [Sphingomonas ginsenosidivorax]TXC71368.1 tryptophan 7-halogenase [Sphingomonas ginsenosidivorax]
MTEPRASHVVILGGGTAGWIAACLIAQRWRDARVTMIESPEIGIVGVGEGSTPQLKHLFDTLGIAEAEWMPACDATYKLGIGFEGWSDRAGYERYFHPFPSALDVHTAGQFFYHARARRTGRDVDAHPDRFLLPARLAAAARGPHPDPSFPFEVSYGYHFDAHKIGAFLARHATETLGVVHLQRRIAEIERSADGDVAGLVDADGERITGDLFVDSSGFRSMIHSALEVPFVSYADALFNDRAVVMPTPRAAGEAVPSQTRATALSAGWAWHIPLTTRDGNGYVYSSRHLSEGEAEAELRAHLGAEAGDARHLKFRIGRVRDSWSHNALAVGLAQGFLEPLEATALHLVIATVEAFLDMVDASGATPETRTAFNTRIAARYDGVRDYIVAHYRLNQRHDDPTGYWAQARAIDALSDDVKALMSAWFTGADLTAVIDRAGLSRYYSAISWHCLMAGYGTFPDDARLVPPGPDIDPVDMPRIDDFLNRCALNFRPHAPYSPEDAA